VALGLDPIEIVGRCDQGIGERDEGLFALAIDIEVGAVPDNSVMELSWDGYDGADWGSRSRIA